MASATKMVDLYSWATPNGHKLHIMLEECALPYRTIPVDIGTAAQFSPEFLAVGRNNKAPAIVDLDRQRSMSGQPISLFESGATMLDLAGKTDRQLPGDRSRSVLFEHDPGRPPRPGLQAAP